MTDNFENISDELLAAYLDGNTTAEENKLIREVSLFSEEIRETIDIARSSLCLPYAYAAWSTDRNVLCCILSEKFILDKKGIDVTEDSLTQVALKNGWFDPQRGTPLACIGKLLEFYGIGIKRKFGSGIRDLMSELQAGHFVIACVDGGELTGDLLLEKAEDLEIGEIPDHAVIVVNIATDDSQAVTLYDFSTATGYDAYPVEQFMDSWADSKFYMISIE